MQDQKFEFGFTLTPDDYRAMMRAYWRLSRRRLTAMRLLIGVTLLSGAVAALSWWYTDEIADAVLAAFLLTSPISAPLLNRLYYDGVFRRQRLGDGPMLLKADADGVSKTGPNGYSRFAWSKVRRIVCAKRHILLWITPFQAVIVPHRAFSDEAERQRFVDFARAKTAGQDF